MRSTLYLILLAGGLALLISGCHVHHHPHHRSYRYCYYHQDYFVHKHWTVIDHSHYPDRHYGKKQPHHGGDHHDHATHDGPKKKPPYGKAYGHKKKHQPPHGHAVGHKKKSPHGKAYGHKQESPKGHGYKPEKKSGNGKAYGQNKQPAHKQKKQADQGKSYEASKPKSNGNAYGRTASRAGEKFTAQTAHKTRPSPRSGPRF